MDANGCFLGLRPSSVQLATSLAQHPLVLGHGFGHATVGLLHGFSSGLGRFRSGVRDETLGGRLGLRSDLGGRLPGGGEHPGGLLAEDLQQHRLVRLFGQAEASLRPLGPLPQLGALSLQALQQGRDLVQEGADLLLLVATTRDLEVVTGDGGAVEGIGHGRLMLRPPPGAGADAALARGPTGPRGGLRRGRP